MPLIPEPPLISSVSVSITRSTLTPPVRAGRSNALLLSKEKMDVTGSLVKERFASNLQQLARRSPSHGVALSRLWVEGRNPWLPCQIIPARSALGNSSTGDGSISPPSSSAESLTQGGVREQDSPQSRQSEPAEERREEEEGKKVAGFTLTLTPEAVCLLQRRNTEKLRVRRTGTRTASSQLGSSNSINSIPKRRGNTRNMQNAVGLVDSRRVLNNGVQVRSISGDISHLLKISLLNDRHRYDDVEYEEAEPDEDKRMKDQVTFRKCTEWLRGLDTATG
ncbi:hypothetical protein UPYG_G00058410 [Umbra pygmaea]|uniref:Uncharacterized protein n=1 Tax=Umbra pygmaea TaxID=75934 RepID=A0ABD0X8S7_UMBPY